MHHKKKRLFAERLITKQEAELRGVKVNKTEQWRKGERGQTPAKGQVLDLGSKKRIWKLEDKSKIIIQNEG